MTLRYNLNYDSRMGTEKKRVGRPPMKDARNITIAIKITPSERKRLLKAAKKAGMSFSEYVMHPHREGGV